jgi:acetyl-CoA acetyltransferase
MREATVAGVGMLPFARAATEPAPVSAGRAITSALDDAGVDWSDVGHVIGGTLSGDLTATWQAIHEMPWTGVAGLNVTNASATGSSAFRQAYLAVASGSCEVAVAVGFGDLDGGLLASAGAGSRLPELTGANLPPVVFGLVKSRRMHEYGEPAETAALVAVKNFGNAARNPDAQRQRSVTVEEVMDSPVVSDPLRRPSAAHSVPEPPPSSSPPAQCGRDRRSGSPRRWPGLMAGTRRRRTPRTPT